MAGSTHFAPSSPVIQTEARKIIITQLPHSTTVAGLTDHLSKAIAASSTPYTPYECIHNVEIARHGDGTSRGHAFATLESHQLAKTLVRALDGTRYKGRTVQARFAKEGAEMGRYEAGMMSPPPLPPATLSSHHRNGKSPRSSKESSSSSKHNGESSKSSSRKVRRDSEGERKEKHKSKTTVVERDDNNGAPMVVDGSSRKHK